MATIFNRKGYDHAQNLIRAGKVDRDSSWSFSAEDGNRLLGDPPDWEEYSRWFLGHADEGNPQTKEYWKYPFGKDGKVYRSALIAIRQRAGQQADETIFRAAGRLLEMVDAESLKDYMLAGKEVQGVPEWVEILRAGVIRTATGDIPVRREDLRSILEDFQSHVVDLVIDYEHQSLKDVEAPAAGWIKEMRLRDSVLEGRVEWTEKAKRYLLNKEYRYLSPVIVVQGGRMRLHSMALTNTPAIKDQPALVGKEELMEKELRQILGLKDGEDVLGAVKALKDTLDALRAELGDGDLREKVKDLKKAQESKGDFVPLKDFRALQEDYGRLKAELAKRDAEAMVQKGLEEGKLTPAQKDWALAYALKDPEGFKEYLDKAPVVVPLSEAGSGDTPKAILDETQRRINELLGVSEETFKKFNSN